jgi:hypothetical protein
VKDVGLLGLSTVPAAERVDATVALIQELIPLGLEAVAEALEAEVTALAGTWRGGPPRFAGWSRTRVNTMGSFWSARHIDPRCQLHRTSPGWPPARLFHPRFQPS